MKSNGIWWDLWDFNNEISSNPMESDEIHEILSIKSYQIQWDLMRFMRFWVSNLMKSNRILWWSYWLNPYPNFYGSELLIIKGWSRKLARRYLPTYLGGGWLIRCCHSISHMKSINILRILILSIRFMSHITGHIKYGLYPIYPLVI